MLLELRKFLRLGKDAIFQNEVCRISYADKSLNIIEERPPLFGAEFNFELDDVVNCPEYLAYFPLLRK